MYRTSAKVNRHAFEVVSQFEQVIIAGGTTISPIDITSPNSLLLAEYHAFRDHAGPPPATRGQPTFMTL